MSGAGRLGGPLAGPFRRGAAWLRRRLLTPEYPLTAVEVRARSVGVVRLARERDGLALTSAACLELPEGTVRLSMTEPNIADPAAFRAALGAALERAGVLNAGRVALVLPDPVARVALLPAAEVSARRSAEVDELIRFRLRKAVPFDIREARVASIPAGPAGSMVLAGAIFGPVLAGYEEAFYALGLHPGLVELAGLALIEAAFRARTPGDHILVNWDDAYVSLVLARDGWPALIRTLVGEFAATPDQVVRELSSTVLYYRERLGGTGLAGAALRSAALPPAEAASLLEEPLGLVPEVLDPWRAFGAAGERLEAAQAVAAAAACVLGRAA